MKKPTVKAYCCNPFKIRHQKKSFGLRNVLPWMIQKIPTLTLQHKICGNCRRKLSSFEPAETSTPESSAAGTSDSAYVDKCVAITSLNQTLKLLDQSPVQTTKFRQRDYPKRKLKTVQKVVKKLWPAESTDSESDNSIRKRAKLDFDEIISQFKDKYHDPDTSKSDKLRILTSLPNSWTIAQLEEFGCSNYTARQAKRLANEKGIMSCANPKPGKTLSNEIAQLVKNFYQREDISREMPGMRDYVSVKTGNEVDHVQKRLILCNLNEIYQTFKNCHPEVKIGFSKFAELRPKHCVLAGASGTHSVCVCTIHQNVKLMMIGANLQKLTDGDEVPLKSYKELLAQAVCNPALPTCYLGDCDECSGFAPLKDHLGELMSLNGIDSITFKQWITTDRSTMETFCKPSEEFIDILIEKATVLLRHSFIAKEQSAFYQSQKSKLKHGEFLVVCDFAENYSFVLQDAAQGFHWNNSQATIHPFFIYFKDDNNELQHCSFAIISDCLIHDTTSVHLFQRHLISFLKTKFTHIEKIYYFSDGAASQYKNRKNFANLSQHKNDFGIDAEWHFFATSHGKGPSDGLAGTLKRNATKASLQRPLNDQIMTPRQLFNWATTSLPSIKCCYTTKADYEKEMVLLEKRFRDARTIPGTRKIHAIIPNGEILMTKSYSNSGKVRTETVVVSDKEIPIGNISGFVTAAYDRKWWLACVVNVDEDQREVNVSFLTPHGPANSFRFPQIADILNIPHSDILTKVDPSTTSTGRSYYITKTESQLADDKLRLHIT